MLYYSDVDVNDLIEFVLFVFKDFDCSIIETECREISFFKKVHCKLGQQLFMMVHVLFYSLTGDRSLTHTHLNTFHFSLSHFFLESYLMSVFCRYRQFESNMTVEFRCLGYRSETTALVRDVINRRDLGHFTNR